MFRAILSDFVASISLDKHTLEVRHLAGIWYHGSSKALHIDLAYPTLEVWPKALLLSEISSLGSKHQAFGYPKISVLVYRLEAKFVLIACMIGSD